LEKKETKQKEKKSKCFVSNQNFEHGLINFLLGATAFGRTTLIRMAVSKTIKIKMLGCDKGNSVLRHSLSVSQSSDCHSAD
jgi:hypothetical protein